MKPARPAGAAVLSLLVLAGAVAAQQLDERPGGAGEWGFRPADLSISAVNPPAFVCRPQKGAASYEWQVARDLKFSEGLISASTIYPVYCLDRILRSAAWFWRFRYVDGAGRRSTWSRVRTVTVHLNAARLLMPGREATADRVPKEHPRLFVRPEEVTSLREMAAGRLSGEFRRLVKRCEKIVRKPPPAAEPARYAPGVKRKSEAWRKTWWGNRTYTIAVLRSAADLAFVGFIGNREDFLETGKQLLLAAASWDPKGATGYRYNDEAGMPFAYWFARAYTFLHPELSPEERKRCQAMMRVRGQEMYRHLAPRHLWRPYSSHSNRAWHFLGELGIAFHGEIPEAAEWLFFATRVFGACYPVWSDDDGGWHEGIAYWRSYLDRFTWWADVMKKAIDVDAYELPFFSHVGDFALYLQPPGTRGGGFGDLTGRQTSRHQAQIMARFAGAARNPYWQWHSEAHGKLPRAGGFIGFLRASRDPVAAKPPSDLPSSKLFRGTGVAVMNTSLMSAAENVQVIFKSSPFGTQSHGYEAQNSFLLYAFGERLLIRSGYRDLYGSAHHSGWMWSTRSTNCITVDGGGQHKRSPRARGRITAFSTGRGFDYVEGRAGDAYPALERFTRRVLFVKPDYVLIHDMLRARKPARYTWWLHAQQAMAPSGEREMLVKQGRAACRVRWLLPQTLGIEQTDKFDPPPRPRVKLVQHHLTARTVAPAREMEFITAIRIFRPDADKTGSLVTRVTTIEGGRRVHLEGAGEPCVVEVGKSGITARRGRRQFASKRAEL